MTRSKFERHVASLFLKVGRKLEKKNADYSGCEEDALKNFRLIEMYGSVLMEAGIMARVSDKFARLCNLLLRDPKVTEESFTDTIEDLIGYLAILHAARTERDQ